MAELVPDREVIDQRELMSILCWDDDEDPEEALKPGVFQTCAGEWRRETDGRWRFWTDPEWDK